MKEEARLYASKAARQRDADADVKRLRCDVEATKGLEAELHSIGRVVA